MRRFILGRAGSSARGGLRIHEEERLGALGVVRAHDGSLGVMLGGMLARARGASVPVSAVECAQLEEEFRATVLPPMTRTLRFECSMLQSPVEDMSGGVRWRDVACGDEDDFEALWGKRHTLDGCVDGDYVLLLPVASPRSWGGAVATVSRLG